ncbi:MAG: hypothetical protein IGR92_18295 [Leptolyngbyaceae cyanobacterium T60_A2020_046]|nr:hypothetical protein [Leptolyngbyaceae cyanobacterium T60_A2020_046]
MRDLKQQESIRHRLAYYSGRGLTNWVKARHIRDFGKVQKSGLDLGGLAQLGIVHVLGVLPWMAGVQQLRVTVAIAIPSFVIGSPVLMMIPADESC